MTTRPGDLVAVAHQTMMLNDAALKQLAAMFNRLALPALSQVLSIPNSQLDPYIGKVLAWLAEAGIGFEPKLERLERAEEVFKNRLVSDIDELYKPYGLGAEDLMAARKDEAKAAEFKNRVREKGATITPASADALAMFSAIQRMTVNMTRLLAIQLRNLQHLDAQAVVPSEFSSLDQADTQPDQHDVVKIVITALPAPDSQASWEQIVEYRSDQNSLNRFIDLRNWINDIALGKVNPLEVEEKLESILNRFLRQLEIHRIKAEPMRVEAFVVTNANVIANLFSYGGTMSPKGYCSMEHMKLSLLQGESPVEGSEVAYVFQTKSLFDNL
jgi:hypothetical protein